MHIVLLTGIYPPALGGPATYSYNLARELVALGHRVEVITYGNKMLEQDWSVHYVSTTGVFFVRWWRYAQVVKQVAAQADVIYSLGTISEGVPLLFSAVQKPKRILRLGGDFLWERYTDFGGKRTLREFYSTESIWSFLPRKLTQLLLRQYGIVLFSTEFQRTIYAKANIQISNALVIENALHYEFTPKSHSIHKPIKLLSMGRLVKFKQLHLLIQAMQHLPDCTLTIVGDGPEKSKLLGLMKTYSLQSNVLFTDAVRGAIQQQVFTSHDFLIIPSLTDISPNTALEAVSNGLPVLITQETGLSVRLLQGMQVQELRTVDQIVAAVQDCIKRYSAIAQTTAVQPIERSWAEVAVEHLQIFTKEATTEAK